MGKGTIDALLVELGFEYDDDDLDQFKSDIKETSDQIKMLSKWVITAAGALGALVTATAKSSDEQGKFSKEIGVTVETLSSLEFAGQKAGDSVEGVRGSLRGLSSVAGQAARGVGGGLEAFGILGVEVLDFNGNIKDTAQLLLEVSGALQKLPKQQQIDLAGQLGLGSSIRLLQLGPELIGDYVEQAKLLGVTTSEDAAISAKFTDSLIDVWTIIKDLSRSITRSLAPQMKKTFELFTDWWLLNKDFIKQNMPRWIDNLAIAFRVLTIAAAGFLTLKFFGAIASGIQLIKSLTIAMTTLNASVLLSPAVIAAAIAAILLIVDEFETFIRGGETVLGDLLESYPEWESRILNVVEAYKSLKGILSEVLGLAKEASEAVRKILPSREQAGGVVGSVNNAAFSVGKTLLSATDLLGITDDNAFKQAKSGDGGPTYNSVNVGGIRLEIPPNASAAEVAELTAQAILDLNSGVDQ